MPKKQNKGKNKNQVDGYTTGSGEDFANKDNWKKESSFRDILLILEQQGITASEKLLWVLLRISSWSTGVAFISEYKTPRALGVTDVRTIRRAKKRLESLELIDVESQGHGKADKITCKKAIERLSKNPKGVNWKKISRSSVCIAAQIKEQFDKTVKLCETCTKESCETWRHYHDEPMANCHPSDNALSSDPCQITTGNPPQNTTALTDEPLSICPKTPVNLSQNPCQNRTQKEYKKEILKERTVTPQTDDPRISGLAKIENDLCDWQQVMNKRLNSNETGMAVDVKREFGCFKAWLFESEDGQRCRGQDDVAEAWESRLMESPRTKANQDGENFNPF